MKKRDYFLGVFLAAIVGAAVSWFLSKNNNSIFLESGNNNPNYWFAKSVDTNSVIVPEGLNFINAADRVRPTVVHVKTFYEAKSTQGNKLQLDPFFRDFFGDNFDQFHKGPQKQQEAAGSGVILSADGYIVTNNHVIDNADKIKVILDDKRSYEAKLIGADPTTDLALLKIDEKSLPFVEIGSSDRVRVGEWVLAVGNPFDLTSTVTAGIVSAKGRNINILRSKTNYAIESFIQTDAAVNPGNSGGALVDLKGRLIGINTAIATPTGSYTGYSFAVPVTIVEKVVADLKNYGEVQRGLLGINIQDVTAELAKEKNLKEVKGVYVAGVNENSAAKDAGIEEGDVIIKINDAFVNSSSELQENVARHRPGDKIQVTFIRKGAEKKVTATLKNKMGNLSVVKTGDDAGNALGAELATITKEDKEKLKIESGVKVLRLKSGKLKDAGIKEGYIITHIERQKVATVKDISSILENKKGGGLLI
ncbi:MAG: Do family serine endopeptidase, partial [Cytophagales bacterium]